MLRMGYENKYAVFHGIDNDCDLVDKSCVLPVGSGQFYNATEKLKATIELLNHSSFGLCDIVIGNDMDQFYFGKEGRDCSGNFYSNSNQWLDDNYKILKSLNIPFRIIDWNEFKSDYMAEKFKLKLKKEYMDNIIFRKTVDIYLMRIINNFKNSGGDDYEGYYEHFLDILLENCAILIPMWASLGYDYIVSPKMMTHLAAITKFLFCGKYDAKVKWLFLMFNDKNKTPFADASNHISVKVNNFNEISQ